MYPYCEYCNLTRISIPAGTDYSTVYKRLEDLRFFRNDNYAKNGEYLKLSHPYDTLLDPSNKERLKIYSLVICDGTSLKEYISSYHNFLSEIFCQRKPFGGDILSEYEYEEMMRSIPERSRPDLNIYEISYNKYCSNLEERENLQKNILNGIFRSVELYPELFSTLGICSPRMSYLTDIESNPNQDILNYLILSQIDFIFDEDINKGILCLNFIGDNPSSDLIKKDHHPTFISQQRFFPVTPDNSDNLFSCFLFTAPGCRGKDKGRVYISLQGGGEKIHRQSWMLDTGDVFSDNPLLEAEMYFEAFLAQCKIEGRSFSPASFILNPFLTIKEVQGALTCYRDICMDRPDFTSIEDSSRYLSRCTDAWNETQETSVLMLASNLSAFLGLDWIHSDSTKTFSDFSSLFREEEGSILPQIRKSVIMQDKLSEFSSVDVLFCYAYSIVDKDVLPLKRPTVTIIEDPLFSEMYKAKQGKIDNAHLNGFTKLSSCCYSFADNLFVCPMEISSSSRSVSSYMFIIVLYLSMFAHSFMEKLDEIGYVAFTDKIDSNDVVEHIELIRKLHNDFLYWQLLINDRPYAVQNTEIWYIMNSFDLTLAFRNKFESLGDMMDKIADSASEIFQLEQLKKEESTNAVLNFVAVLGIASFTKDASDVIFSAFVLTEPSPDSPWWIGAIAFAVSLSILLFLVFRKKMFFKIRKWLKHMFLKGKEERNFRKRNMS